MAASSRSVVSSVLHPRLLTDREEVHGDLHSFEKTAKGFLQVQIGFGSYLLPTSLMEELEETRGQHIAVTLIGKKYYLRKMLGAAPGAVL